MTKRGASVWGDEARDERAIGTAARDYGRHVTLITSLSMGPWQRFYRDIVGGGGIAVNRSHRGTQTDSPTRCVKLFGRSPENLATGARAAFFVFLAATTEA